jgi:hypothetical protein
MSFTLASNPNTPPATRRQPQHAPRDPGGARRRRRLGRAQRGRPQPQHAPRDPGGTRRDPGGARSFSQP